jgi:hypothetical protein
VQSGTCATLYPGETEKPSDILQRLVATSRPSAENKESKIKPIIQNKLDLAPKAFAQNPRSSPQEQEMPLRATEKEFLRCVRRMRDMLKLEDLRAAGKLAKMQEQKLAKKDEAFKEFNDALERLPADSRLCERNMDLIERCVQDGKRELAPSLLEQTPAGNLAPGCSNDKDLVSDLEYPDTVPESWTQLESDGCDQNTLDLAPKVFAQDPQSGLREPRGTTEEFLHCVMYIRDMLELEDLQAVGQLTTMQEQKLATKEEAFK